MVSGPPPPAYTAPTVDVKMAVAPSSQPQTTTSNPPPFSAPSFNVHPTIDPITNDIPMVQNPIGFDTDDARLGDEKTIRQFFQSHIQRPMWKMGVWGYHTESRGTGKNRRNVSVTDFRLTFDITNQIATMGTLKGMDEKLSLYLNSKNSLRQLVMTKTACGSQFQTLRELVEKRIRALGFNRTLQISFVPVLPRFRILPRDQCGACLRHPATDVLCILTCLCMVFYPVKWCYSSQCDFEFPCEFAWTTDVNAYFQSIFPHVVPSGNDAP